MRLRGAVLGVLLVTACSGTAPDPGPRFAYESGEPSCMKHQPHPPGTRYTDATRVRTEETLSVLRYYTANGTKPYCDGKGPTDVDRRWADLYVRLGADRDNVAALLAG
jgi:hypothetical protein